MSSHKYYYRYQVRESEPLNFETHLRRLKKAEKCATTHLLVDLTQLQDLSHFDLNLINGNHHFVIHFLCSPNLFQVLQTRFHISPECIYIFCGNLLNLEALKQISQWPKLNILFSPKTLIELQEFILFEQLNSYGASIYWSFRPYNKNMTNSLTLKDIHFQKKKYIVLGGLEIFNSEIPEDYELVSANESLWQFSSPVKTLKISIIIPTYNNVLFLTNVLNHLLQQTAPRQDYEIIVVDDGSSDKTSEITKTLFHDFRNEINLKFIYWSKQHHTRGDQRFFRAGLARNLGVFYSESKNILFLDSDILVPSDFIETSLKELQASDLIQFQRFHIQQKLSLTNPTYKSIQPRKDTYIEESAYWHPFFLSLNWMTIPNYWKYTCTYALGMRKQHFLEYGGFKKYYVSYGFEDTDLGYCFFKNRKTFKLVQIPLYHLTAYDQMQYKNSKWNRFKLLRKTAALLYLQHLDPAIYHLFGNYYRFEKPILNSIKDLVAST